MRRACAAAGALAALALSTAARAGSSSDGAPGAVVERTLDGTTLVFVARPGAPRAAVRVVVQAGAADDPPGRAGLAELTASAVLQGTYDMRPGALYRQVEKARGTLSLEVAPDHTVLALDAPADGMRELLVALVKTVTAPALPFVDLDRARVAVGAVDVEAAPLRRAGWAARHVAFPSGHGGLVSSGSAETRRAVTRDDVTTFFQARWIPARTVVVVGDLTLEDARHLLEQGLHGAPLPTEVRSLDVRAPNVPSEARGRSRRTLAVSAAVVEPAPAAACVAAAALLELRLQRAVGDDPAVETHAGCERAHGVELVTLAARSSLPTSSVLPELVRSVRRGARARPVTAAERVAVERRLAEAHARALEDAAATAGLVVAATLAEGPLEEAVARALRPPRLDWAGAARVLARGADDRRAVEVAFSPYSQ